MDICLLIILPLLAGVLLDKLLGDPVWLPHLVVGFGRIIAFFEHHWNKGKHRKAKGAVMALLLTMGVFFLSQEIMSACHRYTLYGYIALSAVAVFFCLAGKTLADEVRMVFLAADRSLEEGRSQVSRIVGRDTAELTDQEVRTAALETLAENLSDGVIAPLFWYLLLGVPGMLAYKMINTLDSMIGYRNARYRDFGCWAARMDDVANYIPARLTALLMVAVSGKWPLISFVRHFGPQHASPNSGYPEAALAGILDCRFGGPHNYFGESVYKPFIGEHERVLDSEDMQVAISINLKAERLMLVLMLAVYASVIYFV